MSANLNFVLDPDEPGDSAAGAAASFKRQDDAFCAAMNKAIRKGREHALPGVRKICSADEARVLKTTRVPGFVPSMSPLATF